MRVAMYYNNRDVRLEELPMPKIGPGEVLVKVLASGICGTDVMQWYRIKKAPCVLGHEITGKIVESKSEKYRVGQRVFVSHHVPCNICKYCLEDNHTACETLHKGNYDPGGYSEFIRVPRINVDRGIYTLPDNVSYEEGTMIEPLACVIRGQRVINVRQGQIVLILGSGVSGLLNIQLAKLKGARVIATVINKYRLNKAKEFGADEVINPAPSYPNHRLPRRRCGVNGGGNLNIKADRIIICTDALQAVKKALNCIDRKGIILFFAIPEENIKIPIEDFWRNEITITSSYGAAPVDLEESLELIKNGKINIKDMITHKLPLEEIQEGFKLVSNAKESLKVVLKPNQKTKTVRKAKGFTLVEIMVIISIIIILASIAIPNLLRTRLSANESAAQIILKTISTACENYAAANDGTYPTAISDLTETVPSYLNEDYTATPQKGYEFACNIMTVAGYSCKATPTTCNRTGAKTFTIATGGVSSYVDCTEVEE